MSSTSRILERSHNRAGVSEPFWKAIKGGFINMLPFDVCRGKVIVRCLKGPLYNSGQVAQNALQSGHSLVVCSHYVGMTVDLCMYVWACLCAVCVCLCVCVSVDVLLSSEPMLMCAAVCVWICVCVCGYVCACVDMSQEFKSEAYQLQIEMERLNHQAGLLLKKVVDEMDRSAIQEPMGELKMLWDNLDEKIISRQVRMQSFLTKAPSSQS